MRNDYPHIFDSSDDSITDNENGDPSHFVCDNEDEEIEGPFIKLKKLLQEDETNSTIETPLVVCKSEMMLGVLKFAVTHNLSQTATEDLFKLINSFFDTTILPDSRYHINKLFNSTDTVQFHAVCFNCKEYIKQFKENDRRVKCNKCKTFINLKDPTYTDYFVIYNVEKEIATLVQENSEYFENLKNIEDNGDYIMRDFTDGILYKKIISQLSEEENKNFVSAIINSDGSPVFVSSNFSVWPIQLIINEIPYDERVTKPVVCGMWFGKGKPNMDIYLKPFVQQMNRLAIEGIKCTINGQRRCLKVYVVCCCVDSQARAPMQGIKQYNGYYGCSWCLHPGLNVIKGRGGSIKYIILDEPAPQRTEIRMLIHAQEALDSVLPVKAVKKLTILADLPTFDIVDGFIPDTLYCNNLGNEERFLQYWIDTTGFPYSLQKYEIETINT